jgi:hypothetical protein
MLGCGREEEGEILDVEEDPKLAEEASGQEDALEARRHRPDATTAPQAQGPACQGHRGDRGDRKARFFRHRRRGGASGEASARAALAGAICAFSDVREAAGQERGEYAGHFFMVDAVGLDDTGRAVPWNVLRERVGEERLDELSALFDEVLPQVP